MRLIDSDKLKEHFSWWTNPDGTDTEQKKLFNAIIDMQPTIDAVPVVRCKDCKNFSAEDKVCNIYTSVTTENDYCVDMFGWRKENRDDN